MPWCEGSRRTSDATPQASSSKGCGCRVAPSRQSVTGRARSSGAASARGEGGGGRVLRRSGILVSLCHVEDTCRSGYIGIMIRQNRDARPDFAFSMREMRHIKIKFLSCVERVQLVTRRVRAPITRGARSAPSDSVPTHPSHRDTSRPRDALTATTRRAHRDHSTAHALSCSNRTRCHSVTRGGGQRQSETRRIRDARRHTRPWPRCRQHMHTTHAHQTDSPRSGERDTTSPNRCPASRRACATCNLDTK